MPWHSSALDVEEWRSVMLSAALLLAAALAGLAACRILLSILLRLARSTGPTLGGDLVERLRSPMRILMPLLGIRFVFPPVPTRAEEAVNHLFAICIISVLSWLLINLVLTGRDIVLSRFDVQVPDNLKARTVHTELTVLVRLLLASIVVFSAGTMLMTFDEIRHVGLSILASAGIIGIILGFAAQRSIATLFAGLQIAFTQPIRLEDAVIIEGEWGWVEEITLTYVVIRIWDLRRLVVPVTYFLDKPFQNWTRVSSNLLGTVLLYVDYSVPVDEVRQAFRDILEASDKWDGEVCGVQATNCTDRTVELRLLMSAADASRAFDLRCEVREKILKFLVESHPECLPRLRGDLGGAGPGRLRTDPPRRSRGPEPSRGFTWHGRWSGSRHHPRPPTGSCPRRDSRWCAPRSFRRPAGPWRPGQPCRRQVRGRPCWCRSPDRKHRRHPTPLHRRI